MASPRQALIVLLAASSAASVLTAQFSGAYPRPGSIERVSLSSTGVQADGDTELGRVAMTPDGRYVAFASAADNLVPDDTDQGLDVFVRDRRTGSTRIASVSSAGSVGLPNPLCLGAVEPAISANGRYVVFRSCYLGLVSDKADILWDVFIHDMRSGATSLVSVNSQFQKALGNSIEPTISSDGRYVAFASDATNLDPQPCPKDPEGRLLCGTAVGGLLGVGRTAIYVRDRRRNTTSMVSLSSAGVRADAWSEWPVLSANGRYVAFTSVADNLTSDPNNSGANCAPTSRGRPSCANVYLRDLRRGRTELISVAIDGRTGNGDSRTSYEDGAISKDGRYVAFTSLAAHMVPNDGVNIGVPTDAYVRDRRTARTSRVTVDQFGQRITAGERVVGLSQNGRYTVVHNVALNGNCPVGEYPGVAVALHDQLTGDWEILDRRVTSDGTAADCSTQSLSSNPTVSADGRYVAFISTGTTLVRGDTNDKRDVFVRDRGVALGASGLSRVGARTVLHDSAYRTAAVVTKRDPMDDVTPAFRATGGDLIGVTLAFRPSWSDVFVRLSVDRMPIFELANPALVYGLDLTVAGVRYEVRAAKTSALSASFGLFRLDPGGWRQVAKLRGGYGTTGEEVVVALPLRDLRARGWSGVSAVKAFTSVGSYRTDLHMLDRISLTS